jgi:predicted DNA-binding protein
MGQKSNGGSRREWNTPVRAPWNALIKEALQAVDRHNAAQLSGGDVRHAYLAQALRIYVAELKDLICEIEATEQLSTREYQTRSAECETR